MKIKKESKISSKFGYRKHPIANTRHFHRGVDLVSNDGFVYVGMRGKVIRSQKGRYGEGIYIRTETTVKGVTFYAQYFHNEENYVNIGDYVNIDEKIAKQGNTGESTGIHTHFEIYVHVKDISQMPNILESVKHHAGTRNRIFFNPFQLLEYLKLNYGG